MQFLKSECDPCPMDEQEQACMHCTWMGTTRKRRNKTSSSVVDQPCLDPQPTCCQELGGAAQVFFFFCGRSAVLRPSAHMLPGIGWCGTGLPPFPTACWWLTHPVAITGVSVSTRWDSPGGCGGPSVPLLYNRRVQSP